MNRQGIGSRFKTLLHVHTNILGRIAVPLFADAKAQDFRCNRAIEFLGGRGSFPKR